MEIEEVTRQRPASGLLGDALEALDLNQTVEFQAYSRVVLPLDGYVFWAPTETLCVAGSLHHLQDIAQEETSTFGAATLTFTTLERVTQFAHFPLDTLYIARLGEFRYAFSSQQGYYEAARLWHYQGHRIEPSLETQLLDDPSRLDAHAAIVSNSLPAWLSLNGYASPYLGGFSSAVTLYPSFLVPANLAPPYGVVHIGPEDTRSLQGLPWVTRGEGPLLDSAGNEVLGSNGLPVLVPQRIHAQLMADRVRVTLYGLQHSAAMDFLDCVLYASMNLGVFGLMSSTSVTDGKRTQSEIQAIGMQKIIDFEVSYQQQTMHAIAMQTIASAQVTLLKGSVS